MACLCMVSRLGLKLKVGPTACTAEHSSASCKWVTAAEHQARRCYVIGMTSMRAKQVCLHVCSLPPHADCLSPLQSVPFAAAQASATGTVWTKMISYS